MSEKALLWAFLAGNLVIGTGVMLVPGMLLILAQDLQVSIPAAGLLLSAAAVGMCLGAPLLATLTSSMDRRKLLAGSLLLYALGHAACAFAPNYAALLPLRVLAMLGAAVFSPQAAATLAMLLPLEKRSSGITFIFLGWSVASVAGLPLAAYLGATLGWRATFFGFAVICAVCALAVWRVVPRGLQGVPLSLATWMRVARHPTMFIILAVTVVSSSGQFSVWSYVAPYTAALFAPSKELFSGLLLWFGVFGLIGNVLATRMIATRGAAFNVNLSLLSMTAGLLLLIAIGGSAVGYMACGVLWGLGVFASNSSQQARLAAASPDLAGASIALNTSMMYLGQAIGATLGGAAIGAVGYAWLPLPAVLLLAVALFLSVYAQRLSRPSTAAAPS